MHRRKFLLWGQSLIEHGAWFLAPISLVWASVVFCKNFLYRHGLLRAHRVDSCVVSIGNIVAGGTGKTPFVHLLATVFSHRKIAILSRGYGEVPDEAILLQRRLPGAKVYIGKDRVALAQLAAKEGAEIIILDDGLQHRRLHRDIEVILLRGEDPFGKGHFLPWGFLRDTPKRLQEADAIFVSGQDVISIPTRILGFYGERKDCIRGMQVGLFCGVANPRSFKKIIEDLGGEIVCEWILADHEAASERALKKFSDCCRQAGARILVTTEKDFVKLPGPDPQILPIFYVEIEARVASGSRTWENLIAKIDQKIENRAAL